MQKDLHVVVQYLFAYKIIYKTSETNEGELKKGKLQKKWDKQTWKLEHDTTNWKFDFMYLYSTVCLSVYFAVL